MPENRPIAKPARRVQRVTANSSKANQQEENLKHDGVVPKENLLEQTAEFDQGGQSIWGLIDAWPRRGLLSVVLDFSAYDNIMGDIYLLFVEVG